MFHDVNGNVISLLHGPYMLPGHIVRYVVNEQPLDPTGGDGRRVEVGT